VYPRNTSAISPQPDILINLCPGVTVHSPSHPAVRIPPGKPGLLLVRLSLHGPREYSRDQLVEAIWPECDGDVGRPRLRFALSVLRSDFGISEAIVTSKNTVGLDWSRVDTDVERFRRRIRAISRDATPLDCANILFSETNGLVGDLADQFSAPWIDQLRQDLRNSRIDAYRKASSLFQSVGEVGQAEMSLRHAIELDRFRESIHRDLMQLLADSDRSTEAIAHFDEFRRSTLREIGIDPSDQLKRLAQRIIHSSPSTVRSMSLDEPLLASNGSQEANSEAGGIGQRQIHAVARNRPLVRRPNPLFGREELLETVRSALSEPNTRVVLVGALGSGKSHLLKEAAWWFSHTHDLPIQFGGTPNQVDDGLFIPDISANREETIESIEVAARLGWRVLAESRIRLDSDEIGEFLVGLLPVPKPDDDSATILKNPSVQILLSRGAESDSNAQSDMSAANLAEIARRLDGLPLALRAFADKMPVETPEGLLRSLDRGLVGFSRGLTSDDETVKDALRQMLEELPSHTRDALYSLSFLDGVSFDLAAKLASPHDAVEVLRPLEERFLVTVRRDGETRRYKVPSPLGFVLCELLNQVVRKKTETGMWQKVADWVFWKSRSTVGLEQEIAFDTIQAEMHNLMRGLRWAIKADPAMAAYMVSGIWRTVCARGNPSSEGFVLLEAARLGGGYLRPRMAGEMWVGTAASMVIADEMDLAEECFINALHAYEEAGDSHGKDWANINYATSVLAKRDLRSAIRLAKEVADQATRWSGRNLALSFYSFGLADLGEVDEAIRVGEAVFANRLQFADLTEQARAYSDLAELYRKVDRPEAALPLLTEGIRRLRENGIQDLLLQALLAYADLNIASRDTQPIIDEAEALAKKIGSNSQMMNVARLRLQWAAQNGDRQSTLTAVEDTFRYTQLNKSPVELKHSLRALAGALDRVDRPDLGNAIRSSIGDAVEGTTHEGWKSLLSSDSKTTICVLAVAMAKEGLAA